MKYLFLLLFIFASSLFAVNQVQKCSANMVLDPSWSPNPTVQSGIFDYQTWDGKASDVWSCNPNAIVPSYSHITFVASGSAYPPNSSLKYTTYTKSVTNYINAKECKNATDFSVDTFPDSASCQAQIPIFQGKYPNQSNSFYCQGCSSASGKQVTTMYQAPITCPSGQNQKSVPDGTANVLTCQSAPACIAPKILNDTNSTCIFPSLSSTTFGDPKDPYTKDDIIYNYANGTTQICSAILASCATWDKDGNLLSTNIPINGTTYQTLSQSNTNRFVNVLGVTIGTVAGTAAIIGSGGLLLPSTVATLGTGAITTGLFTAANAFTETPYTINSAQSDNVPSTTHGIRIDLSSMDFSKENSSASSSINASGNKISTVTNQDGSKTSVEFTPTQIISTNTDNSGKKTIVKMPSSIISTPTKNDFSSTNNLPGINYSVTVDTPTTINNTGTVTSANTKQINKTLDTNTNHSVINNSTYSKAPSTSPDSITTSSTSNINSTGTSSSTGNTTSTTQSSSQDLTALTSRLNQMINQGTVSNSKLDKSNNTQGKILSKLNDILNKQPSKGERGNEFRKALQDQNLSATDLGNAFLQALEQHDKDKNLTYYIPPNNSNTTNPSVPADYSKGESYVENAITSQYSKSYTIFKTTSCGTPVFDPDITFMGFTVSNPLPIMEAHTSQYYNGIKVLVILSATLLGLISIFRR